MNKLFKVVDKALLAVCLSITGMMAVVIICAVFLRYVLGITFVWAEEVITMLFLGTTFFGAALVTKEDEHINIPIVLDAIPAKAKKVMLFSGYLISIIVILFLFFNSLVWIKKAGDLVTPGLRVPERYFYYMVPVSSVLMLFYFIRRIAGLLLNNRQHSES